MKTFCIETLGCKVNQYESEQLASLLRVRGLTQTSADRADLRIINTCSVTVQAASQSRQSARRMTRLPVLSDADEAFQQPPLAGGGPHPARKTIESHRPRVLVTGCWATSDRAAAAEIPGIDAVLTHHDNLAAELDRLLTLWRTPVSTGRPASHADALDEPFALVDETIERGSETGSAAGHCTKNSTPKSDEVVNAVPPGEYLRIAPRTGANSLPLLGDHQSGRQRAFLKVQDGCDAHCTYCIIPQLRPVLFSKPIEEAVEEARRLVDSGHVEIVLTGIFLGAYGHATALRRRQTGQSAELARLVEALCTRVRGLRRVRLSSLEPGDLSADLLDVLASHPQVVPHFHLPLQSGSDDILRRMNRQYRRDDFLRTVQQVHGAFDRPALTTDVIVGFPGETDEAFEKTLEVVHVARFIHIHAFPYSPRPGTAAARWNDQFIRGPIVNERIDRLRQLGDQFSYTFRSQFVGQSVEVITERGADAEGGPVLRHGRSQRYFPVHFESPTARDGEMLSVRVDRVTPTRTFGTVESGREVR